MSDPLTALTLALEETEGVWRGCGSASWMAKVVWPVMEVHLAARAALAQPAPALDVEALARAMSEEAASRDGTGLGWATLSGPVRDLWRASARRTAAAYAAIALAQPAPAPGIDVEALARALPNALSLASEQDQTHDYSEEPGSPYVRFLAAAIAAAYAEEVPALRAALGDRP